MRQRWIKRGTLLESFKGNLDHSFNRDTSMKKFVTCVLVCFMCIGFSAAASAQVVNPSSAAESVSAQEMPPALKNMEGTPGYDLEHQKWLLSQHTTPLQEKAIIERDVNALKQAQWNAPETPVTTTSNSEGAPYHNYKGITDPVKAKEAWMADQPAPTK